MLRIIKLTVFSLFSKDKVSFSIDPSSKILESSFAGVPKPLFFGVNGEKESKTATRLDLDFSLELSLKAGSAKTLKA